MNKFLFIFPGVLLSACLTQPTPESTSTASLPFVIEAAGNPHASTPEDANLQIGGVELTSMDLSENIGITPVRVVLRILGSLPRTCNALRIDVPAPNAEYKILVKVYSLLDPNVSCEYVFKQFQASVLFGVYSTGRYTVWVNGSYVGDFVAE
jgi:hypothetical protein